MQSHQAESSLTEPHQLQDNPTRNLFRLCRIVLLSCENEGAVCWMFLYVSLIALQTGFCFVSMRVEKIGFLISFVCLFYARICFTIAEEVFMQECMMNKINLEISDSSKIKAHLKDLTSDLTIKYKTQSRGIREMTRMRRV